MGEKVFPRKGSRPINMLLAEGYVPDWAPWTTVREIYQNLIDALNKYAKDHGGNKGDLCVRPIYRSYIGFDNVTLNYCDYVYSFRGDDIGFLEYNPGEEILSFKNPGVIPRWGLAMGGGDKQEDNSMVGRHGEGLKITALVALNHFRDFWVETGKERWNFMKLEDVELTKLKTLHLKITSLEIEQKFTTVNIQGIPFKVVHEAYRKILPLSDINDLMVVHAFGDVNDPFRDSIIFAKEYRGNVHLHNIHVNCTTEVDAICAYNIWNRLLKTDRDRNTIPDINARNIVTSRLHANIANGYVRCIKKNNFEEMNGEHIYLRNYFKDLYYLAHKNIKWIVSIWSYLDVAACDEFFKIFANNSGIRGIQPVCGGHEYIINEKIRKNGVGNDFYRYVSVSGYLWNILSKSSLYESFEKRYDALLKSQDDYLPNEEQEKMVQEAKNLVQKFAGENFKFDIKFKKIRYDMRFKIGNVVYLSDQILCDIPKVKLEFRNTSKPVVAKIFDMVYFFLFSALNRMNLVETIV